MLTQKTIKPTSGSKSPAKRVGRGNGSGRGTYSWRGMNGQNSRSGGGVPDWFEGGQTPLFRRMPKLRGFSNAKFKKHFNIINLSDLEIISKSWTSEINKDVLLASGVITKKSLPVKLLGKWEITSKVTLSVDVASKSAISAIEKAGGSINLTSKESEEK